MTPFLTIWVMSLVWAALAAAILRFNAQRELQYRERLPAWLVALIVGLTASASFLLPPPWNAPVAFAIAGFGVASWGDWSAQILWDEIVVGTMLLVALAMLVEGGAVVSLEGAIACGSFMYVLYFVALALGRETGFGDVKLAAGIGLALGPLAGLAALAFAAVAWLVVLLVWARTKGMPLATLRVTPLPFGPGLTLGLIAGACAIPYIGSWNSW